MAVLPNAVQITDEGDTNITKATFIVEDDGEWTDDGESLCSWTEGDDEKVVSEPTETVSPQMEDSTIVEISLPFARLTKENLDSLGNEDLENSKIVADENVEDDPTGTVSSPQVENVEVSLPLAQVTKESDSHEDDDEETVDQSESSSSTRSSLSSIATFLTPLRSSLRRSSTPRVVEPEDGDKVERENDDEDAWSEAADDEEFSVSRNQVKHHMDQSLVEITSPRKSFSTSTSWSRRARTSSLLPAWYREHLQATSSPSACREFDALFE